VLAVLAGVTVVLAVSGPFDTRDTLALSARLLYWGGVVFATYAVGTAVDVAVERRLAALSRGLRLGLSGLAAGVAVWAVVVAANTATFGRSGDATALAVLWLEVTAIVFAVILGQALARGPRERAADARPAILDRLPLEKRGELIALSVQDHYVEVVTTRGRGLVLMRLSDAIRETAPAAGLQVHRSHWAALGHVHAVARRGDGAVLTMATGDDIPVSRRYVPQVREAGLLPRPNGGGE